MLELVLYLLLFLLPIIYWSVGRDPSSLPRYVVAGGISAISLVFWALAQGRLENRKMYLPFLFLSLFLFLGWACLSGLWTVDVKNYNIEIVQLTSFVFLCFIAVQMSSVKNTQACFRFAVFGASLAAIVGIMQYYHYNPFNLFVQYAPPASTFTNKNFAALYFDLLFPPAFVLLLITKKNLHQWLVALGVGVIGAFIVVSHTRGSWLGLLGAGFVGIFLVATNPKIRSDLSERITLRFLPLLFAGLLIVGLSILPQGGAKDMRLVQNLSGSLDGSSQIRLNAYRNALEMIKDMPLSGTGFGGFRLGFRRYMNSAVPMEATQEDTVFARLHSDPLQTLVELGLLGGLLQLMVVGGILWQCYKLTLQEDDSVLSLLGFGLLLALLSSCVHGLVDFPLRKPSSAVQFWVWSGLAMGLYSRNKHCRYIVPSKIMLFLVGLVGSIFFIYNSLFYAKYMAGNVSLMVAQERMKVNDCQGAKKAIRASVDVFGLDFLSQMYEVSVYSRCPSTIAELNEVFDAALKYDSTNTRALLSRGTLRMKQGNLKDAAIDFRKVTELLPHRASGYIGLGKVTDLQHGKE